MKNLASKCESCNGCRHQNDVPDDTENGWCYLFYDKPKNLPCAQHDKYELEREITGKMIQKFPFLLYGMMAMADLERDDK